MMQQKYQLDYSLDSYIEKLVSYGIQVNSKLKPALFYLKNGLIYTGLLTTAAIEGNEQLVKVPIELLLTTLRAVKDNELTEVFSDKFYQQGQLETDLWQDRILVTYILYLLSSNRDCIWTFMAKQFSKDIDIISFWNEDELDAFVDKSVIKAAKKERNYFQAQWQRFTQIQGFYQQLKDQTWFNKANYKWIYTHTISRCFGSFLNCTYFVPFCQLFNHHQVDVSYTCVDQNKPKIQSKSQTAQTHSEDQISSGYSEDYFSDDDFDYMSINSYSIKWCSKISYDLKEKETIKIEKSLRDIYEWIDKELEWRGFTYIYLGQIIEKLKILQNEYKAGRKKFQPTLQKIQQTKNHLHAYRKYLFDFYKNLGRQYQKVKAQRGAQVTNVKNSNWTNYQKNKQESKKNYSHFKMQAIDRANFKQNSQIYFCYGKLSNRTLLVRYGFSLQNNPHDHVWIKFKLQKQIQPYPDLFQLIQNKGLSVNYKVKLKSFTFALEPIVFFRMCEWKLTHHTLQDIFFVTDLHKEIQYLSQAKEIYLEYLSQYKNVDYDLIDSSLNYHQYFVKVYNIEKKKIIQLQIELVDYVSQLLHKIRIKQVNPKDISIKVQYRKLLKHYLKGLRGLIIN